MATWTSAQARARFAESSVARLATADAAGRPHLVPVTFAVYGDTIATGLDHKPKSSRNLKRLRNIMDNPRVSLLADEYSDDWDRLWWTRADGDARVEHEGEAWSTARGHLIGKYRQYQDNPPDGPVILVSVRRWSGWSVRTAPAARP
ncbi:TIGR03668 family PPOX class F420-dependent oxidoreductase [Streptomonospora nanhaiensis]|uniref:PPOX class probable F420-dependent enzyme n=1 Tax=Streptomonospora nanhaiensis TaxID=1323731 RepID=A0A853BMN7_9ACTN|nr:TIGR03668 family PPOX class F420-dependent oxidoreductase [Streptomonospora nanhaiensis]MBV2361900.1 TIGR03668 family PPOX class F420-dependent oxidoreductase [Streptomonospora nanhaiensis]NYI96280.1 PPOX class probable F420-dependent enzyme [Streptomonospora nanhaiensis]